MAYHVQKTFDINQDKRKPIGGVKGAVLVNDSGRQFLQLKLKNNSSKSLDKVPIKIDCYDMAENFLGTQEYTYDNVFVQPGDFFGTGYAVPLEYSETESISIRKGEGYHEVGGSGSKGSAFWIPAAIIGALLLLVVLVPLLAAAIVFG